MQLTAPATLAPRNGPIPNAMWKSVDKVNHKKVDLVLADMKHMLVLLERDYKRANPYDREGSRQLYEKLVADHNEIVGKLNELTKGL